MTFYKKRGNDYLKSIMHVPIKSILFFLIAQLNYFLGKLVFFGCTNGEIIVIV